MMRDNIWNIAALFLGVLSIVVWLSLQHRKSPPLTESSTVIDPEALNLRLIKDASARMIPARPYKRIASLSVVADEILSELCEPQKIVAVTKYNKEQGPYSKRWINQKALHSIHDIEALITLNPDLILTHQVGDPRYLQRLRERGLSVFDLGEVRGLEALFGDIQIIGELIEEQERSNTLIAQLKDRIESMQELNRQKQPIPAIYLSALGKTLYGGTRNTSYADLLRLAGANDLAAERYRDWPAYTVDEVLEIDPPWIVTATGIGKQICAYPGLEKLAACTVPGHILELDHAWVSSAGISLIEAAEKLREKISKR